MIRSSFFIITYLSLFFYSFGIFIFLLLYICVISMCTNSQYFVIIQPTFCPIIYLYILCCIVIVYIYIMWCTGRRSGDTKWEHHKRPRSKETFPKAWSQGNSSEVTRYCVCPIPPSLQYLPTFLPVMANTGCISHNLTKKIQVELLSFNAIVFKKFRLGL